jgi:hypothetical protein
MVGNIVGFRPFSFMFVIKEFGKDIFFWCCGVLKEVWKFWKSRCISSECGKIEGICVPKKVDFLFVVSRICVFLIYIYDFFPLEFCFIFELYYIVTFYFIFTNGQWTIVVIMASSISKGWQQQWWIEIDDNENNLQKN